MRLAERIAAFDVRLSLALQRRRHPLVDGLARALSLSGYGQVWFALAGLLWAANRFEVWLLPRQVDFFFAMGAALAAFVIGEALKRVFKRTRPFGGTHGITAVGRVGGLGHSLPSTHAATSVALAVALLRIDHPLAWLVSAWALGVCASRVWLGVHYGSDVVAGAVLGVACGVVPIVTSSSQ